MFRASYNSQGQLNQINAMNADGSGGALLSYSVYRGDGKRAWKQSASGSRTYFFYDGDTLIGTSGDAANTSSVLLWGADGLIGTQTKNASNVVTSNYFLYDAQGNLAQTVTGAGVVTTVAAYTAWGEVVPRADGTKPSLGSFGYGAKFGYWRDSDSGLYLCTLRFYDPANGRFVTRDPIGFRGGSNLFGYTGNDPANNIDPSGLDWSDYAEGAASAVGGIIIGGAVVVAVGFASPEIAFGLAIVGTAIVIESVGKSIYRQWTGTDPFTGQHFTPEELDYDAGQATVNTLALFCGRQMRQGKPTPANGLQQGEVILPPRGKLAPTRLAPFGNATTDRFGRLPHYHRAIPDPNASRSGMKRGQTLLNQGAGRHRPYETYPGESFWDRF